MKCVTGTQEELLAKAGGLSKESVKKIADDLFNAKGKGIVVAGGSVAAQTVAGLLNSALENEGKASIDGSTDANLSNVSLKGLLSLVAEMEAGLVDTVIINKLNPAYFLPNSEAFVSALKKVKNVISVNERIDETSNWSDLVLQKAMRLKAGAMHIRSLRFIRYSSRRLLRFLKHAH